MTAATATPAATQSHCTTVIVARDFCGDTTDVLRDTWTPGKLHHVAKALNGLLIAVTADKQTGHTISNVKMLRAYYDATGGRVSIEYVYNAANGGKETTNYRTDDIGMIMVMPTGQRESVKWDALQSYREHQSAAIAIAKEKYGETRKWGSWKATILDGSRVDVTYTPHTGNDAFADQRGERGYWRITVAG